MPYVRIEYFLKIGNNNFFFDVLELLDIFIIAHREKISLLFLKGKLKNRFKFFKGEW